MAAMVEGNHLHCHIGAIRHSENVANLFRHQHGAAESAAWRGFVDDRSILRRSWLVQCHLPPGPNGYQLFDL
jgi:hypothetical protein